MKSLADKIVGVQPMNSHTGKVFKIKTRYTKILWLKQRLAKMDDNKDGSTIRIYLTLLLSFAAIVFPIVMSIITGNYSYILGGLIAWSVIGYFVYRFNKTVKEAASEALNVEWIINHIENKTSNNVNAILETTRKRNVVKFNNLIKITSLQKGELCVIYYINNNSELSRKEKKYLRDIMLLIYKKEGGFDLTWNLISFYFLHIRPKGIPVVMYMIYFIIRFNIFSKK